jgi:hypothetical protein
MAVKCTGWCKVTYEFFYLSFGLLISDGQVMLRVYMARRKPGNPSLD